ncbi:MAG TPA: IS3 family transposase, partial [Negativicutes bacterium]|nr:IS3 family transposase [Negativicutes bacterium]
CLGGRTSTAREKSQVITELRQKHKLAVLLDVAHMARATYYYHLKQADKPDKFGEIKRKIRSIY